VLISVSILVAVAIVFLRNSASRTDRQLVFLAEEDDANDEFYGNDMSMYATQCCSPQDISCCHTQTGSAWVPGAEVVDISRRCECGLRAC
jgi:hypothetical protein